MACARDGKTRLLIDYFALILGHGLLAIAFLRLFRREDLDCDSPAEAPPLRRARRGGPQA